MEMACEEHPTVQEQRLAISPEGLPCTLRSPREVRGEVREDQNGVLYVGPYDECIT